MATVKYRVYLTSEASTCLDFELAADRILDPEDPDDFSVIEDAFWESNASTPTLCHQCAGGTRHYGQNLDLGDEWEIVEITTDEAVDGD